MMYNVNTASTEIKGKISIIGFPFNPTLNSRTKIVSNVSQTVGRII